LVKVRRGTRSTRREGGQPGNLNRQKSVKMPDDCDLSKREGVEKFLREFLIPAAVSGELGVRTITALTTCSKVLLDAQTNDLLEALDQRIKSLENGRGMRTN